MILNAAFTCYSCNVVIKRLYHYDVKFMQFKKITLRQLRTNITANSTQPETNLAYVCEGMPLTCNLVAYRI
jgi:hypothetical protein